MQVEVHVVVKGQSVGYGLSSKVLDRLTRNRTVRHSLSTNMGQDAVLKDGGQVRDRSDVVKLGQFMPFQIRDPLSALEALAY